MEYLHVKTGNIYDLLNLAIDEESLEPVVVYRQQLSGLIWVRPASEFFDGRFHIFLPPYADEPDDLVDDDGEESNAERHFTKPGSPNFPGWSAEIEPSLETDSVDGPISILEDGVAVERVYPGSTLRPENVELDIETHNVDGDWAVPPGPDRD